MSFGREKDRGNESEKGNWVCTMPFLEKPPSSSGSTNLSNGRWSACQYGEFFLFCVLSSLYWAVGGKVLYQQQRQL
ncbi:hypothetical protein TNCV_5072311 [Trichonephila clavipes]|nr:hypothetical protein TNCV_5072311 [Trichonephila clavipes]